MHILTGERNNVRNLLEKESLKTVSRISKCGLVLRTQYSSHTERGLRKLEMKEIMYLVINNKVKGVEEVSF